MIPFICTLIHNVVVPKIIESGLVRWNVVTVSWRAPFVPGITLRRPGHAPIVRGAFFTRRLGSRILVCPGNARGGSSPSSCRTTVPGGACCLGLGSFGAVVSSGAYCALVLTSSSVVALWAVGALLGVGVKLLARGAPDDIARRFGDTRFTCRISFRCRSRV